MQLNDQTPEYRDYVSRQVELNAQRVAQWSQFPYLRYLPFIEPDRVYEHVLYRPLRMQIQTLLYHQTSAASAASILASGTLLPGNRGRAGPGIYFAFTPEATHYKALRRGVVIEVLVSMGKCMDCGYTPPSPFELMSLLQDGYDSVMYYTPSGPELVVYSPDQCKPVRVL